MRLTLLDRLIIPVATALLATIAAVTGSYIGATTANSGALETQRAEFAEERAKEARDRRTEAYLAFLKAADGYHGASVAYNRCIALPSQQADEASIAARCAADLTSFTGARATYLGAINDVLVFGSDEAVRAANELDGTLPRRLGWNLGGAVVITVMINSPKYVEEYEKFTRVMCHEVLPSPRATC